jgi:hypothetical protein
VLEGKCDWIWAATEDEQVIRLALISKAATDLAQTCRRSELSSTDIVNRAISLHEFLDEERTRGTEMLLRRRDGSVFLVELL